MEKQPQFIKDFSKEKSKDDRDKVAQEIKEVRQEKSERNETELQRENEVQKVEELEREIEIISDTLPKKLLNYFKYRKTLAKLKGQ